MTTKRPMRMKRAAFLTALAVLLSGCVTNARQDTLKPHGTVARQLDHLFDPVFWIAVGVFCLVAGLVTVAIFRFRARSDDEAPRQVHGHTLLELTWTILPAMLLAGIAIPTVKMVFDINRIPKKAMVINVTGHRWWWQFDYVDPSDPTKTLLTTANELHMPTKEKVVITLTSVDVIHNFWIPALGGKRDAIPRHTNFIGPWIWTSPTTRESRPLTTRTRCRSACGPDLVNRSDSNVARGTPAASARALASVAADLPLRPVTQL